MPPPPPSPTLQGRGDRVRRHWLRDEGQVPKEPPARVEGEKEAERTLQEATVLPSVDSVDGTG